MTPTTNKVETTYDNAPDDFREIMELTQEEKQELLKMWKSRARKILLSERI